MSDSNAVTKLTSAEGFKDLLASKSCVIVDFYADWCGPCKVVGPKFAALAPNYPNVTFASVNVDDLQETASEMGIRSIPTFIVFRDGKQAHRVVGGNMPEVERILGSLT